MKDKIKKDHVDIVLFIFQGILENIEVFTNKDKANKYYNEILYFEDIKIKK